MDTIARHEYHVTWKADGTRYMLLLMRDGTYLIDRKFEVRRVSMRFPAPLKSHGVSVHNATLLDGEMVIDDVGPGRQRRRFLAYDCVALHGERLGDRAFVERISSVQKQVVDPRNVFLTEAGKSKAYDFAKEPFSVRVKDFTPLAGTEGFIRSFIPKLCHECDGAFFVIFIWAIGMTSCFVHSQGSSSNRRERGTRAAPWTRCSSGSSRTSTRWISS
mgnify:FL=1